MRRDLSIEYMLGFATVLTFTLFKDLATGENYYALVNVGNIALSLLCAAISFFNKKNPIIHNRLILFLMLNFCFMVSIIKKVEEYPDIIVF